MTNDQKQKEDIEVRTEFFRLLKSYSGLSTRAKWIGWLFFKHGVAWQKKGGIKKSAPEKPINRGGLGLAFQLIKPWG